MNLYGLYGLIFKEVIVMEIKSIINQMVEETLNKIHKLMFIPFKNHVLCATYLYNLLLLLRICHEEVM